MRAHVCLGCLAVPAGVGVGDVEAEGLEVGDERAQAAVVVEPGLVVGELVVGQDAGGGLAVFLAGPLVVGAVQPGRVGVAAAVRVAAAGHPVGQGAGQGEADAGEAGGDLGGEAGGLGLLGRGGRHALIFAAGVPDLAHLVEYKCCMDAEVAAYTGRWRPVSVPPEAAALARLVTAGCPARPQEGGRAVVAGGPAGGFRCVAGAGAGAGGGVPPVGDRAVRAGRAGPVRSGAARPAPQPA